MPVLDPIAEFRYEIDDNNIIVEVDEPWLEFAMANDAPQLSRENVLGVDVFRFVAGRDTSASYGYLFDVLRRFCTHATVPFRCDSPGIRRYMELAMQATEDRHVHFVGRLLRLESRPTVPLLDAAVQRKSPSLAICGVCRRVETQPGQWQEIEAGIPDPYAVPPAGAPRLSYTLCPHCAGRFQRLVSGIRGVCDQRRKEH